MFLVELDVVKLTCYLLERCDFFPTEMIIELGIFVLSFEHACLSFMFLIVLD